MARKLDIAAARLALQKYRDGGELNKAELQLAVRYSLEKFACRYPGKAVEIRIPWIAAVQALPGVNHRRGTPPNVVEMDGKTWLQLVIGGTYAPEAISASGAQADISAYFPMQDL